MTGAVHERHDKTKVSLDSETDPPSSALVVCLRHEDRTCIASFSGAITDKTRATIDGVTDLIAGEESVVLDFSRVDVIGKGGADAVDVLVRSVRARGAHLRMTQSRCVRRAPLCRMARAKIAADIL
jgi:hypothetical protein